MAKNDADIRVRIPEPLREGLELLAQATGHTLASYVREILRRHLVAAVSVDEIEDELRRRGLEP